MLNRRLFLTGATAAAASTGAGSLSAVSSPARAQEAKGAWTPRADMPFAVQEIYPTLIDRNGRPFIVNAGGLAVGLTIPIKKAVTVYDPQTNEWTRGQDLPEARHHIALAWTSGALHAIGGFKRKGLNIWATQAQNWRIADPATGEWETARPLPAPQAEAVTLVHNGRIHMIGGRGPEAGRNLEWTDQSDIGRHWAYDPVADDWTAMAPLPSPRNSAAGAILGGELYVISGRTVADGNNPTCHAYDPTADAWREIAALPAPIRQDAPRGQGGLAAAAYKGKLFAFGGEWFASQGFGDGGVYADAWEYDPSKDAWAPVAPMARPRHGLGGVAIEGHGEIDGIYAIGGALRRGGDGVTAYVDRFTI
ncbi:MAG: galactose oxidase [Pseudomonadota bacterium]